MKPLIPDAALQQHIIVLGKTGAGKSSAIRAGFVEPLLERGDAGKIVPGLPPSPMARMMTIEIAKANVQASRAFSDAPASLTVRKILDVIHRSYPVSLSFDAAARRAGVSKQSSAYRKYRRELERSSEIEIGNDGRYSSANGFGIGGIAPGAGVDDLVSKLPPSYGKMLKVIHERPGISSFAIADLSRISQTSSGLGSGLRELQRLELIERHGDGYRVTEGLR